MTTILSIKELTGGYLPGVNILQGINLDLQQGEAVGIIGLNGSGKSTLGKAIMNMLPFRQGEIIYEGKSITSLPTSELAHHGISIMQQGGQVFQTLSVWDNLQLAFGKHCDIAYIATLKSLIPLIRMPEKLLRSKMADKLSGGQRHQLALTMALARHPRLLILDEPSAGLSPKAVEEMYGILETIRSTMNITILLIEQNISKVIQFCNYCLMLKQGYISYKFTNKNIKEIECLMFKK